MLPVREVVEYLLPPFLFVLPLALGLLFGRSRFGRAMFWLGSLSLVISSFPVTGKILAWPVIPDSPALDGVALENAAVVVPTGGIYEDAAGQWWPSSDTAWRLSAGQAVRGRLDLPLFVTGGNPTPGMPSEANVALERMGIPSLGLIVDTTARTSFENATAARDKLWPRGIRRIVLVTTETHMPRMVAVLRAQGFEVIPHATEAGSMRGVKWRDFVPGNHGLQQIRTTSRIYAGLLYYWLLGRTG